VKSLLVGCREPSQRAKLAYAECLGAISAIDPGRLSITIKPEIQWADKEIDDFDMASGLIANFLVKAFRASTSTKAQDRAAYAIQELLKFCGCIEKAIYPDSNSSRSRNPDTKKGVTTWAKFPDDVKEIIKPFLSSCYDLKAQTYKPPSMPIYGNVKTFREWVGRWASWLIYKASGTKKPIFEACR
jgi:serine/threonine-protein kinase ATR